MTTKIIVSFLLPLLLFCQPKPPSLNQSFLSVGQSATANIIASQSKQHLHYLKIEKLQKKYLFIRLELKNPALVSIGIYQGKNYTLVSHCQQTQSDSCFLSSNILTQNSQYVILIVTNKDLQYTLSTYWGDVEHIRPNEQVRFQFDGLDNTQLFHLEYGQQKFQQIKISVREEVPRDTQNDLRIYASPGDTLPSAQSHRFSSITLPNSHAIFLSQSNLLNQTSLSISITGSSDIIYIFQCIFIDKVTQQLKLNEGLQDYISANTQKLYELDISKEKEAEGNFVIKISTFSGEIEVGFFMDPRLQNALIKSPYQYMGDMQFNFQFTDLPPSSNFIYLKVKSSFSSIYQISSQTRKKTNSFQIFEGVYEFSSGNETKSMYFFTEAPLTLSKKLLEIKTIEITGKPAFTFYLCRNISEKNKCLNKNGSIESALTSVIQIKAQRIQQVASQMVYTLSLENINKQGEVLIIIDVKSTTNEHLAYCLEYVESGKVRQLKEGKTTEDRVGINEAKYYKFINTNSRVTEVKIHVNEISGLIKYQASFLPFKSSNLNSSIVPSTKTIKQNPNEPSTLSIPVSWPSSPIFIEVVGLVTSIFSLSVSLTDQLNPISNILRISQDIEYEFILKPDESSFVELHPIEGQVIVEFYSEGSAVLMCEIDSVGVCFGEKVIGSDQKLFINAESMRTVKLKITNYLSLPQKVKNQLTLPTQLSHTSKVTLKYHSRSLSHCESRKINKVYSQTLQLTACIKFNLPLVASVLVMISRSDFLPGFQEWYLCETKINPLLHNGRFSINESMMKENCKHNEKTKDIVLQLTIGHRSIIEEGIIKEKQNNVNVLYSVEYDASPVQLTDGISYQTQGISVPESPLRVFSYFIIDTSRPVTIILTNQKGQQTFHSTVSQKQKRFQVTPLSAQFHSSESSYFRNPKIEIKPSDISKQNCSHNCYIITSIYSNQKEGEPVEYSIQITQNHIYLKQGQGVDNFLGKGSSQFYQFQGAKGTIILKVSDGNRRCTAILMSKRPFPTDSNYVLKQFTGMLVYDLQKNSTLYFSVTAVDDCPYTVAVTQSKNKFTKLQYGQLADYELGQGQEQWYYTWHSANVSFKVINMKKFGEIAISSNQTSLQKTDLALISAGRMTPQRFLFQSSYKNTLEIQSTSVGFCFECFYLIRVKAKKISQGSIIIGLKETKITLAPGKTLFDQMHSLDSATSATFYRVSPGVLNLKVHSGKIHFEMAYAEQKYSKSFSRNLKVYQETYLFSRNQNQSFFSPLILSIKPEQVPAVYSFQLLPQKTTEYQHINPGEHSYIYLSDGEQQCLIVDMISKNTQIFVSVDSSDRSRLKKLVVDISIGEKKNEKKVQRYGKQIVGNILSIQIQSEESSITEIQKFTICVSSQKKQQGLSLMVFQNQNVNLIHSDIEILIRNQSTFVLYPNSDIILDIFQCKGEASIHYSSTIETLKQKESKKTNALGLAGQTHAIKIVDQQILYVNIEAEKATVLWMPLDFLKQRGVGYFKYEIGGLQYLNGFKSLEFQVGCLFRAQETNTTIKNIKYTLFISDKKQDLQSAIMCQESIQNKVLSISMSTSKLGNKNQSLSFHIDKKRISEKFSTNTSLYYNVIANVLLIPPNQQNDEDNQNEHEHYRFFYSEQQLPSQVFNENKMETLHIGLLVILVIVSVTGLIAVSWVFVKWIVPALGRLKNRMLVQQKEEKQGKNQNLDDSIPVPPSSQRNRLPAVAVGTDEQFKEPV